MLSDSECTLKVHILRGGYVGGLAQGMRNRRHTWPRCGVSALPEEEAGETGWGGGRTSQVMFECV